MLPTGDNSDSEEEDDYPEQNARATYAKGKVCSHSTNYPEEDFTNGCWALTYKDKGRASCNPYSSAIDRLSDRFFARR
jgi:hypothetical protein